MKETYRATYREIHVPANDMIPFFQALYGSGRVGTLTISIGTGGVPCGMMIWKERVMEEKSSEPAKSCVESTPELISLR